MSIQSRLRASWFINARECNWEPQMKSHAWTAIVAAGFLLVAFSGQVHAQSTAGVPDYDYRCPPASCKGGKTQQSGASQSAVDKFNAIQQNLRKEENAINNATDAAVNAIQEQQEQQQQQAQQQQQEQQQQEQDDNENADTSVENSPEGTADASTTQADGEGAPNYFDPSQSSGSDAAPNEAESASNVASDVSNVLSGDNSDTAVAADVSAVLSGSQMGTHFYGVAGHVPPSSHPGPGWFDTPSYDVPHQRSLVKITSMVRQSMTCKIAWTGIKLGSAALGVNDTGASESGSSTIEVPAYPGNGPAVSIEGEISGVGITGEQTACSDN